MWRVFCLSIGTVWLASNFAAPAGAQTEVGGALVVVHGAHTESNGRATGAAIPAPLFYLKHRLGRVTFRAEGIPPIARLRVLNSSIGLNSIELSYVSGALSYLITPRTSLGIGQTIYNQETTYNFGGSSMGQSTVRVGETDRSRATGMQYSLEGVVARWSRSSVVARLSMNPRMTGIIGQRLDFTQPGAPVTYTPWRAESENGSQVDAALTANVQRRRLQIGYGVRYLNLIMRFSDGALADRNAFVIPFVSVGTVLGR